MKIGQMLVEINRIRRDIKHAMRAQRARQILGGNLSERNQDANRKPFKNKSIYVAQQMGAPDKF